MASTITHKKSSTASAVPVANDLSLGELAINTTDGKVYMKKGDNSIVEVGGGGGGAVGGIAHIWQTLDQSVATNAYTTVEFGTEQFDTLSEMNLTNGKYTPTVAGYYFISSSIRWDGTGSFEGTLIGSIAVNGSRLYNSHYEYTGATGTHPIQSVDVSGIVYCNGTTDYIEIHFRHDSGSSQNIKAGTGTYFNSFLQQTS